MDKIEWLASLKPDENGWFEHGVYDAICHCIPIPSVDVVLFDLNDEILLLKRKIFPLKGTWCLAGCGIRLGEYPSDTVKRALKTEAGIDLSVVSVIKEVCSHTFMFKGKQNISIVHYAIVDRHSDIKLDWQHDKSGWFSLDKLPLKISNDVIYCIKEAMKAKNG
jgi:ADP-ribose pyrophosphatase YjhB (NUDIX family)